MSVLSASHKLLLTDWPAHVLELEGGALILSSLLCAPKALGVVRCMHCHWHDDVVATLPILTALCAQGINCGPWVHALLPAVVLKSSQGVCDLSHPLQQETAAHGSVSWILHCDTEIIVATFSEGRKTVAEEGQGALSKSVCRPVYVSLPMTLDRQQSDFMKHMRKSGSQMSFGRQDSVLALQNWSSQEKTSTQGMWHAEAQATLKQSRVKQRDVND
eukprot:1159165-Pelagomonas_calceolata.AAC.1